MVSIAENNHYALRKFLYFDLAGTYACLGEKDKAIQALEELETRHSFPNYMVNLLVADDPLFDSIRDDPRYKTIVQSIEEKHLRERERVQVWLEENGIIRPSDI